MLLRNGFFLTLAVLPELPSLLVWWDSHPPCLGWGAKPKPHIGPGRAGALAGSSCTPKHREGTSTGSPFLSGSFPYRIIGVSAPHCSEAL